MNILVAIIGLSVVLFIHELGHFIGARVGGMRVRQLALGFGKRLFGIKRNGTDYRVNLVPFGGYAMVDGIENPDDPEECADPRKMQNRPVLARVLFTIGGPLFNFALAALLIFTLTAVQGLPIGSEVFITNVEQGSAAEAAGLLPGDIIIDANGQSLNSSSALGEIIRQDLSNGTLQLQLQRDNTSISAEVTPRSGRIGVLLRENVIYSHSSATIGAVLAHTGAVMHEMSTAVIKAFAALITGKTGLSQFSGPIGMVSDVAATAATGWSNFLTVLALISINLGWFNLFPFPALDGGRLILLGLEGLFGLRFSEKKQVILHLVGFAAIFLLIIFVTVKDVLKFVI
mgnify:CR=1 FL=1